MGFSSERLEVLLSKESTTYRTTDYLKSSTPDIGDDDDSCAVDDSSSSVAGSSGTNDEADFRDSEMTVDNDDPCQHEAKKRKLKQGDLPCPTTSIAAMDEAERRQMWREKLCEWAYQVVDHFGLAREIVSITMNTFDRYCAVLVEERGAGLSGVDEVTALDKDGVALTAMTALSLAIKLNEYKRILIPGARSTMETILRLGRGSYSLQQFEANEYDVLKKLEWMVHPPTPQLFLRQLLAEFGCLESQASCNEEVRDLAVYLIEISVLDYSFSAFKSSEIALAALLNSIDTVMAKSSSFQPNDFSLFDRVRVKRTSRVIECQQRLALVYRKAAEPASFEDPSEDFGGYTSRMASPVSVTADLQG